jgi:hypothetical protein
VLRSVGWVSCDPGVPILGHSHSLEECAVEDGLGLDLGLPRRSAAIGLLVEEACQGVATMSGSASSNGSLCEDSSDDGDAAAPPPQGPAEASAADLTTIKAPPKPLPLDLLLDDGIEEGALVV